MNKPLAPTQDEVIQSWHERAHAYDDLIKRWPIFTDMVERLLEFLPNNFDGHALDIGGGSGLLTEHLLKKCPNAQVTLVEPANEMRALASRRLGNRIEIKDLTSDNLNKIGLVADAAFSSASFHLMNEETTLPSVASILNKQAVFAANLWGHSFNETIEQDQKIDWIQFIDQALNEFDQPPMQRPKKIAPKIKSSEELRKIGKRCGLHLIETNIVTDKIDTQFNIEFAAMNLNFLNQLEIGMRKQVINRALKLCRGVDTITSVDLIFKKV